jgi:hypothetical protein
LSELALPAASAPPTIVTTAIDHGGRPRAAKIMVGRVVTSKSSITRGFVSAT